MREAYLYPSTRVRVLENYLPDATDLERMVDAKDAAIAFRVLYDTEYASELLDLKPEEYAKALDHKLAKLRDLFDQILPEKDLFKFLFLKKDFHNMKVLFKHKHHQTAFEHLLSQAGTEKIEELKKAILENLDADLDPWNKSTIEKAKIIFEKDYSPDNIDNTLDRKYSRSLFAVAERLNNEFIKGLVLLQGDIANMKIFLRSKKVNKSKEWLKAHLVERGNMPDYVFLNHFEEADNKNFLKAIEIYFPGRIKEVVNDYLADGEFWKLEKGLEHIELDYVKQSKLIGWGPEVIVGYYYAQRNALRNVRTIMTGKFNNIPAEEIRQRVREVY